MSYYPEQYSHIRDQVKVVIYLPNYAIKKKLDHATGVDESDLAAKINFIDLEAEVVKLDINEINWLIFQLVWII